ncbi:hypothetical protein B0H14DRAFT_2570013 [Mycena olivaceomarginata]|nr:hypothetical protein B0H14DRAFT_2570013 [Mycena olivaceomarginata]
MSTRTRWKHSKEGQMIKDIRALLPNPENPDISEGVAIFLNVSVVPIARVSVEDRYAITKVRCSSSPGFYGVTAYWDLGKNSTSDKTVDAGIFSPVIDWVWTYLIEDIYRRLATMFPETDNWVAAEEQVLFLL